MHALAIELSLVADAVSTPHIGSIRMQFWRNKIASAFDLKPAQHPVPQLLSYAHSLTPLSQPRLIRLLAARESRLNNLPFPNLSALEQYAETTYSTLLYLTLSSLPLASQHADHLASHIGKATGIAAVLRGVPLLAFPPPANHHSNHSHSPGSFVQRSRQGAVTLPLDIMAEAGVREEDVFRLGSDAPGLQDAVFAVATRASDHLITAREMLKNLRAGRGAGHDYEHASEHDHQPGSTASSATTAVSEIEPAIPILLPAVSTALWLKRLEQVDFDIFKPELRRREWKLPWRAYWAWRRRTF